MTLDQESELTTPVNAEHRGTASNIFKANVQSQSARVQFLLNSKQGKKMETLPKNAKQCVWKSHILHLASCNWGPDKPHCNGCFWMSLAKPVGNSLPCLKPASLDRASQYHQKSSSLLEISRFGCIVSSPSATRI